MFATAESLARRGAWDIEQIRWMDLQQGTYGLDGLLYSRKGIGQPLLALPLTWFGLILPGFGPATTTLLFGAIITACTGLLIFLLLKSLHYTEAVSMMTALVYGTGTMAWPYAKTFFSDTLAGTLLLISLFMLILYRQTLNTSSGNKSYRSLIYPFLAGLGLFWAIATRYAEAVFLPIYGLLLLAYVRVDRKFSRDLPNHQSTRHHPFILKPIFAFCLPIACVGFFLLTFNNLRYGNPIDTGYLPEETFSAIWWQGIYGQLLSPGRGLLLYNPILWLSFLGVWSWWKRYRFETLLILTVILVHVLLYGKWFMWHGGFAWGPRFMVSTLPFWTLLIAPVLEILFVKPKSNLSTTAHPLLKYGILLLWAISILIQIPGWAIDFSLWQNQLLQISLPMFDWLTFADPSYSPLLNTWQFITLANLDVAWVVDGQIAWMILSLLLINLFVNAVNIYGVCNLSFNPSKESFPLWRSAGAIILTTLTVTLLLLHSHHNQPPDLHQAFQIINQHNFPLIYHQPEEAIPLAELDQGHQPTLGILTADPKPLDRLTKDEQAIWLLSTYQPDLETYFLRAYSLARRDRFNEFTLSLFAKSDGNAQVLNIQIGDSITLQAVRLGTDFQSHMPFGVELTWHTSQILSSNYQVFIHLINGDWQTVAQTDGQPLNWTRPTSTWKMQETITDPHALWLPNLPPDTYRLITGLYRPETGERLMTSSGENFMQLGQWTIE